MNSASTLSQIAMKLLGTSRYNHAFFCSHPLTRVLIIHRTYQPRWVTSMYMSRIGKYTHEHLHMMSHLGSS